MRPCSCPKARARGPYSALLRVGLAMPAVLPRLRWALPRRFTIPLTCRGVSSLWRFPLGYPSRALPGTLASWSPDFPRMVRFRPSITLGDYEPHAVIRPSARSVAYACGALWSTDKFARRWASWVSTASSGPVAQGRKRRRKAVSN